MLIRTTELTDGEQLLIYRRRGGETQADLARRYGVSLYQYRQWETDKERNTYVRPLLGTLRPHEQCLIKRTRSGKSVNDLARDIGICSWWLTQMERGDAPVERLLAHWS